MESHFPDDQALSPPPGAAAKASTIVDHDQLAKAVHLEFDRSTKLLDFLQGQADKDRNFYKHLFTLTGTFLGLLTAAAAYFQFSSVSQMRADIAATAKSALDANRAALDALQGQANATQTQAIATMNRELIGVQEEVRRRVDAEFRSENIQKVVAAAAERRTAAEMGGVIRSEAAAQVAKGIREQSPAILSAVRDQTKEAIRGLEPEILDTVDKATEKQIREFVDPVRQQIISYGYAINIERQISLAMKLDQSAFDYLYQVAQGKKPESKDEQLRAAAQEATAKIIELVDAPFAFKSALTDDEMRPEKLKAMMASQDHPNTRALAVRSYPESDRSVVPILMRLIETDKSLLVEHAAVDKLNQVTGQSFRFYQKKEIGEWWSKNRVLYAQPPMQRDASK